MKDAQYWKEYRERRKISGIIKTDAPVARIEPITIDPIKEDKPYVPSPVYWSYYVTKGSDIYHKFKAIEKEMELSQSLSGTP